MIGGITYFHAYAYDLLAENERITAAAFDAAHRRPPRRAGWRRSPWSRSSMVYETTDRLPVTPRATSGSPAAAVDLRLPEARHRVLRPGRVGAVRAALHDRPAVQLRRRRREPRPRRRGGLSRQRQAGDEPRRARPRAEGPQGPGPAAHPRRRATRCGTTPTAATSPAASVTAIEHPAAINEDFNLSTPTAHDRARAGRADLDEGQGPGSPVPVRLRRAVRVRRAAPRARTRRRRGACSGSRRRRRSTRCSTR